MRVDCDVRDSESRSKSSAACVAQMISDADLVDVNGVFNLRYFAGGGESNESAPRAEDFLAKAAAASSSFPSSQQIGYSSR